MDNKYLNYIAKNYKDEIVLSTGMTNKNYLQKTHLLKKIRYICYVAFLVNNSTINTNINNINYIEYL